MKNIYIYILFFPIFTNAQCFTFDLGEVQPTCEGDSIILDGMLSGDTLSYIWSTGDTLQKITVKNSDSYSLTISSPNCEFSDTVNVEFLASPVADFSAIPVCSGEPTLFINNSTFLPNAKFNWDFGDQTNSMESAADVSHVYDANGAIFEVQLTIDNQNGCINSESKMVEVLLTPNANFSDRSFCQSETIEIPNNSNSLDSSATLSIRSGGQVLYTGNANEGNPQFDFDIPGSYGLAIEIRNGNGCRNSDSTFLEIFALPSVSFAGLDDFYCSNSPVDTLLGQPAGGSFVGPNVTNLGGSLDNSIARLEPRNVGEDLEIIFSYTDSNGCSNTTSANYRVAAHPNLEILGLADEYCIGDPEVEIYGNQPSGSFMGNLITDVSSFDSSAFFNPILVGLDTISYSYTNADGCSNLVTQTTQIFGVPMFTLGPDRGLLDGDSLVLSTEIDDTNLYDFEWSNGVKEPSITVFNPGLYFLSVKEKDSNCTVSDTIRINLNVSDNTILANGNLESVKVYPNPFRSELYLQFKLDLSFSLPDKVLIINQFGQVLRQIMVNKFNEVQVLPMDSLNPGVYYLKIG